MTFDTYIYSAHPWVHVDIYGKFEEISKFPSNLEILYTWSWYRRENISNHNLMIIFFSIMVCRMKKWRKCDWLFAIQPSNEWSRYTVFEVTCREQTCTFDWLYCLTNLTTINDLTPHCHSSSPSWINQNVTAPLYFSLAALVTDTTIHLTVGKVTNTANLLQLKQNSGNT